VTENPVTELPCPESYVAARAINEMHSEQGGASDRCGVECRFEKSGYIRPALAFHRCVARREALIMFPVA
jgi:hypothetical protein